CARRGLRFLWYFDVW
nr:immunoglobulin heavy chain junction region [Mus musculus]MBK4187302.1 immunoglobulin heavy chain junction region [Mus musculus]